MSSIVIRIIREEDETGYLINRNGVSNLTLRTHPFSTDTYSLTAVSGENGCYQTSISASDTYKLFIGGVEDTSWGGTDGLYLSSETNNAWTYDRISQIYTTTNVLIGATGSDVSKLAVYGNQSITGNLYVSGSINAPALSSLTANISLSQYATTSNFVSSTANLNSRISTVSSNLNSLSSTVGNLNRYVLTSSVNSITSTLTGATIFSKTSSQIFNTSASDNLRLGADVSNTGYKLDVQGVTNLGNSTMFGTSGEKGRITWGGVPQSTSFYALGTNDVSIGTQQSGELIRGTSAGNVGINTTTPNAKLTVNGSISSTGTTTHIGNTSLSGSTSITGNLTLTSGNIGIGVAPDSTVGIYVVNTSSSPNSYGMYFSRAVAVGGTSYGIASSVEGGSTLNVGSLFSARGGSSNRTIYIPTNNSFGSTNDHCLYIEGARNNYFAGNIGVGTIIPTEKLSVSGNISVTGNLDINSNTMRLRTSRTPSSSADTGNAGDICWDTNYLYVCTATNTWKRTNLSSW